MDLTAYHKKRNFKKSSEPIGKKSSLQNNLYVIQKHAASHLHYDFRIELDGVLKSWAVPKGPSLDPKVKRLAVHVEDHPVEYGSFEGVIPQGEYGAGTVMLWDTGTWQNVEGNAREAYKKGNLTFILKGKKLKGTWKLIRIKKTPKNWLLIKIKDKYASDVKEDVLPTKIFPQLCTLVTVPPEGKQWLHEIKFDGYRLIAFIKDQEIRLVTRGQQNWTKKFPEIVAALKKLKLQDTILDGEIVVLDEQQHSNFQLLQNSIKEHDHPFVYFIFDILCFQGRDLMGMPLLTRKKILKELLGTESTVLPYSDYVVGQGKKVWREACRLGLEGIVSKNKDSLYQQKRSRNWLKIKCLKRQEFIIGGFTRPEGTRKFFGSLLLGIYNKNNQLEYCGNVGTGFSESSLKNIAALLKKHRTSVVPFVTKPAASRSVTWVEPVLIAEIEFSDWTKDGKVRHPSFKGICADEKPYLLTHPNKIIYPKKKLTKAQVADYYYQVQDWILPYIVNRPLTFLRCPEGVDQNCFYQKHLQTLPAGLYSKQHNIFIKDNQGLYTLIQWGVLEIHPWGSRINNVECPDTIVFDLDPAPLVPWKKVVAAALLIKNELQQIKLKSFVKSTGGKGLHVVVPVQAELNWEQVKQFVKTFVQYIVQLAPKDYVSNMRKSERTGKIFIDYLRNHRGATAIAPYSTRATAHATVAAPIDWDELTVRACDTTFTIPTMLTRLQQLKQDPWRDFVKTKQSLRVYTNINNTFFRNTNNID